MSLNNTTVVLTAEDKISSVLDKITKNTDKLDKQTKNLQSSIIASTAKIGALVIAAKQLYSVFSESIEFNIKTEQSKKAIAGLISSVYQIQDASGNLATGMDKYNKSLIIAESLQAKLLKKSIETASSYESLRDSFQAGLAVGADNGFSADQILDITSIVDGARKMYGLDQNQLSSELRAILSGQITNNSTIGSSLGLRGDELYKEALVAGKGYDYLIEKMKFLKVASEQSSEDVGGLLDTLGEMSKKLAADSLSDFLKPFSKLKEILKELTDENGRWGASFQPILTITNKIAENFGQAIVNMIEGIVGLGKHFGDLLNSDTFTGQTLNLLINNFTDTFNLIKREFNNFVTFLKEVGIFDGIVAGIGLLLNALVTSVKFTFSIVAELLKNIGDSFTIIVTKIEKSFQELKLNLINLVNFMSKILPEKYELDIDTTKIEEKIKKLDKKIEDTNLYKKSQKNNNFLTIAFGDSLDAISNDDYNKKVSDSTNSRLEKEKEAERKNVEEIKNYNLKIQKEIDEKTIEFSGKAAEKVVGIWSNRLNYLKELVNFQLQAGQISEEQALNINKSLISSGVSNELNKTSENFKKQMEELQKQKDKFTKSVNFESLDETSKQKYNNYLKQLNDEKLKYETAFKNEKKTIVEKGNLELLKLDYNYNKKQQEQKRDLINVSLKQEKELINQNEKELELNLKQKIISEKEYYLQKQDLIKKQYEVERKEIENSLKNETDIVKKQQLQNNLLNLQRNQQLKLKEVEVERLDNLSQMNSRIVNSSLALQKLYNEYNSQNLDFEKNLGTVDLEDYYNKKINLSKEAYEIEIELIKKQADETTTLEELNAKLAEVELKYSLDSKKLIEEKREALINYKNELLSIKAELEKNQTGLNNLSLSDEMFNNDLANKLKNYDEKDRDLVKKHLETEHILNKIKDVEENINNLQKIKENNILNINKLYAEQKINYEERLNLIDEQNKKYDEQYAKFEEFLTKTKDMNIGDSVNLQINEILNKKDAFFQFAEEGKTLYENLGKSLEDGFTDILTGAKSVEDSFKSMISNITQMIMQFIAQQLVKKMLSGLGEVTGISGSGGAFMQMMSAFGGAVAGKASGGLVRAGHPLIVGETGKELFVPQTNGQIINSSNTKNITSTNNNQTVINNYTVRGRKGDRFEDSRLNEAIKMGNLLDKSKKNT